MSGLFGRSEEHRMLHEALRRFVRNESDLDRRNRRLHTQPALRMALWQNLAELGALGAGVAEAQGGFGGTMRDIAVVQDALAPGLGVEPVLAACVSARLLSHLRAERALPLLESLITGERVFILAHAEGFDPFAATRATAIPTSDGFRVSAKKPCVRGADVATDFLLTAHLLDGALGVFLVQPGTPGLTLTPTRMIDAGGAADVLADDMLITANAQLDFAVDPTEAVTESLEYGLVGLCAETAALTEAANRATYDYLNTRVQFGTKLAQFQALQHRAADMAIAHEEATAMAEMAIGALDGAPSAARSRAVLAASLACDAAGRHVAHEAIQMFGGMGVSDELVVSHYARRLAAIRAQIGTMDSRAARLTALEENLA